LYRDVLRSDLCIFSWVQRELLALTRSTHTHTQIYTCDCATLAQNCFYSLLLSSTREMGFAAFFFISFASPLKVYKVFVIQLDLFKTFSEHFLDRFFDERKV